jgi:hypothetical protein
MATATIEEVQIFGTGRHNGMDFDESDLDEMVRGFQRENLSGRLPVKLGHDAPDTAPAAGWITRVWRDGEKLVAALSDIPDQVMQDIREGRWRFCSIELLRDVKCASGRAYKYLLDGLALLGSARPAVDGLKPLHESMTRAGLEFEGWLSFVTALPGGGGDWLRAENQQLRAQLHRERIDSLIEGDVRAGVCRPAAREQFKRLFKLNDEGAYGRITPDDWKAFRASQPPGAPRGAATHSNNVDTIGAPDAVLVERTRQYLRDNELRHLQLTGERLTFERAAHIVTHEVARTEPALLRRYIELPGEAD